jgi:cbb3-type cytochrome oxidase subunit 3
MNLVKEYLVTIAGVHIYAIISMVIFLVAFIFILYQMYKMGKEEVKEYSRLPIDDDESAQN